VEGSESSAVKFGAFARFRKSFQQRLCKELDLLSELKTPPLNPSLVRAESEFQWEALKFNHVHLIKVAKRFTNYQEIYTYFREAYPSNRDLDSPLCSSKAQRNGSKGDLAMIGVIFGAAAALALVGGIFLFLRN
jgi:hypothetical protein